MQFSLLASTLYVFGIDETNELRILITDRLLEPLWYVTGFTTVVSGLGYLDGSGIRKMQDRVTNARNIAKEKAITMSKNAQKNALVFRKKTTDLANRSRIQTKARVDAWRNRKL